MEVHVQSLDHYYNGCERVSAVVETAHLGYYPKNADITVSDNDMMFINGTHVLTLGANGSILYP